VISSEGAAVAIFDKNPLILLEIIKASKAKGDCINFPPYPKNFL
jgi:hypothetical protein